MMPSFSSLENSALAAANLAGSRRRNRPVPGSLAVLMWCTVLCLTGGRPPAALATDWNSLKMPLKAGGVASMAAKRPLLAGGVWSPQVTRLQTAAAKLHLQSGLPPNQQLD